MDDRRIARRYNISLTATIQGRAEPSTAACQGRTRDISSKGVYILVDGKVKAGVHLNVDVVLADGSPSRAETTVRAVVKVVRVDLCSENGPRVGLAGAIVHYQFVRNESIASKAANRPAIERSL